MPPRIESSYSASEARKIGRKRKGRRSLAKKLTFLATTTTYCYCLLQHNPTLTITVDAEPHSTIPRSNNRYTHYYNTGTSSDSSSSGVDTLSSPLNRETYHPPWNPSPKIDPSGFLSENYPRSPGEWEEVANIRGKHGPRNERLYAKTLSVPVKIRQVPGDGNCLFHSIAACLHHVVNGTHLPMDSYERIGQLRSQSLSLRNSAVDVLLQNSKQGGNGYGRWNDQRLFLQGEEYLEASELLNAAAAQFDLAGEEYCELMRKESYWGGGPEIVALCNYLQRPIHIYELIPAEGTSNHMLETPNNNNYCNIKTSSQFTLRRMACFGSPKFDRREPLHILSADSRFPDIEPRRVRKVGNHFLALFPVNTLNERVDNGDGEGNNSVKFRRHALIRGGSRVQEGSGGNKRDSMPSMGKRDANNDKGSGSNDRVSHGKDKWDGGLGRWKSGIMDWFVQ